MDTSAIDRLYDPIERREIEPDLEPVERVDLVSALIEIADRIDAGVPTLTAVDDVLAAGYPEPVDRAVRTLVP